MRYERIARVAHEVNRAYCEACGDYSNVRWEEAPEWQQTSAIEGVKAHALISLTPRESHTLPPWQQTKDILFSAVVKALLTSGDQ